VDDGLSDSWGPPRLLGRLGLAQANDFVALLVLTALLEEFDALETLQDVAFRGNGALPFEAAMLRHGKDSVFEKGRGLYGYSCPWKGKTRAFFGLLGPSMLIRLRDIHLLPHFRFLFPLLPGGKRR
jgi:hypothetical protein